MPRIKSNKEYALKLVHPYLGDFYYKYKFYDYNLCKYKYIFTKNLSKVCKWKTITSVEKESIIIIDNLKKKHIMVLLSLDKNIDNDIVNNLKSSIITCISEKYLPIKLLNSKIELNNVKSKIYENKNELELILENYLEDIKDIKKELTPILNDFKSNELPNIDDYMFKNNILYFLKISSETKKLYDIFKDYVLNKKIINNFNSNSTYLDIVDATNNFRGLKMKNLKNLNNNNI